MNLRQALAYQDPLARTLIIPAVPDWRERKFLREMQASELGRFLPEPDPSLRITRKQLIQRIRNEFNEPLVRFDGQRTRRWPTPGLLAAQGGWMQAANETLAMAPAAGTNFTTYTTAKTVLPTGSLFTLPTNWWTVGRMQRMTVHAGISNRVTGPDSTTFQYMMGAVSAFGGGAMNLTSTANTTLPCWAQCLVTCRVAYSATANLMGQWIVAGIMFNIAASQANSTTNNTILMAPATAPAVGTNFDSTGTNVIDFFVAQSVSNAGNGIQVHQYAVEAMP